MDTLPDPDLELDRVLRQVQADTDRVLAAGRALDTREIIGYSRDGEVTVRLRGSGRFTDVTIDPDALRSGADALGALVLEAIDDGTNKLAAASADAFAPFLPTQ